MSRQTNLAYDLSKFEEMSKKPQEMAAPKPVALPKRAPQASPLKSLFFALLAVVVCSLLLYSKVQVSELYTQITEQTNTLNEVKSEGVRMQSELDSKMSLKNVEDYAVNVLGMQKIDKGQQEYISLEKDNLITVEKPKTDNFFLSIRDRFEDFMEYIGF